MERVFESQKVARSELITPEVADKLLREYRYEYQRRLSDHHVAYLAEQMVKGLFTSNTIILAEFNGQFFLVNGQHTLWAVFQSGIPITLPVLYYVVHTEEELARLYTTLDTGKVRRPSEGYAAYQLEDELNLEPIRLNSLYAITKIILADFVVERIRRQGLWEIEPVMRQWAPWLHHYIDLVSDSPIGVRTMLRRDLGSVALVTLEAQPELAKSFWMQVAADDGLVVGDPRKTLHHWVRENKAAGRGRISGGVTVGPAIRAVTYAWNAWYEDRPLRHIRVPSVQPGGHAVALPIKGTQYVVGGAHGGE